MKNIGIPEKKPRKRLSPENRRRMILDEAISFFAEYGFDGSTRQLARHLGVTQPLIYQYFPSKAELIEAVYQKVFEQRWEDEWSNTLADQSTPLVDRLEKFYTNYCEVIHDPTWMRIYLFAGLRSNEINQKYNPLIEKRIIRRICEELRIHCGLPTHDIHPITPAEIETVWTLHGGIFYYGVRRYVYKVSVKVSSRQMIRSAVLTLVNGYEALVRDAGVAEK